MRRITLWLFSTLAALVLLFSYRTSTDSVAVSAGAVATAPPTSDAGTASAPTDQDTPDAASAPTSRSSSATTTTPTTYAGPTVSTRWGDVQVVITVADGKITDVAVPVYPNGNHRDQEINAYALPVLRQETLGAQSADIATVSGATVTSDGYRQSLQAALDSAHLA